MNTVISGNQLENIGTLLSDVIISGNQLENTDVAGTVEVSSEDELALLNVPVGTVAYIIGGEAWQKNADGTWESYGSGGGGSSDFSTAEVTFTGSTTTASIEGAFFGGDGDAASTSSSVPGGNTAQGAVNLVLYKGNANVMIKALRGFTFNSINATGNVQEMGTNLYIVTGDCNFEILS